MQNMGARSSEHDFSGANNPAYKHGHHANGRSPTYVAWRAMIQRCYQPKQKCYKEYGAVGIVTCDRWRIFTNFLHDMGERPQGNTLDRRDGTCGYYKENCRWATKCQQAH